MSVYKGLVFCALFSDRYGGKMNLTNLKVGDRISLPIYPFHDPREGRVVYIHPERRFFSVEFTMDDGVRTVREDFNFYGPLAVSAGKNKHAGEEYD